MRNLILVFIFVMPLLAQSTQKYEPPDGRVIHGLGQYVSYFYSDSENWQLVQEYQNSANKIPTIYSVYAYIDPLINTVDPTDFIDITSNHGYPYVLVVGVGLFDSSFILTGNVNIPVQAILNGDRDVQIRNLAQRIKAVNAPVYLRPGFEFGSGNSGFHNDPDMSASDFVNIWLHIYDIFAQENVTNVAWVWNTVNPNQFNYMDWYPGDAYVDWWGINYFTDGQISHGNNFLSDAASHDKPVMVCESCPIQGGGTTNSSNWNDWFVPYFDKIKTNPNIKAFIYIHDTWDKPGFFDGWPDSRINSNSTIQQNYANEMLDSVHIHMDEYLANPNIIGDNVPPDPVYNFGSTPGNTAVSLHWDNPSDPDFAGVRILRSTSHQPQHINDGTAVFDSTGNHFFDTNLTNGVQYFYSAFAYDTVPNFSEPAFTSAIPVVIKKIKNDTVRHFSIDVYPNPFNSTTQVRYRLNRQEKVYIALYTITGQEVLRFEQGTQAAGEHIFQLNAANLPSGIYICRIFGKTFRISQKIMLLK